MTFVSYAQNFEDVMLWRALKHVQNGLYVDVGAQHPIVDSVSKAFYERGWRGIHIEPVPAYAEMLRKDRPDETVLQIALSDTDGTLDLNVIPNTGLSTAVNTYAQRHQVEHGFEHQRIQVPTLTLKSALKSLAGKDVHWLKIDVEGFEKKVLKGWDSQSLRPWVMVVEATIPDSPKPNYARWEPILTAANYLFVYFDGLNRFYVAKEHAELVEAFSCPPNVFDGVRLSGLASTELCRGLIEAHQASEKELGTQAEAHAQLLQNEWDASKARATEAEARTNETEAKAQQAETRAQEQEQRALAAEAHHAAQAQRIDELGGSSHHWWQQACALETERNALRQSWSWRSTVPLRWGGRLVIHGVPGILQSATHFVHSSIKAFRHPLAAMMRVVLCNPSLSYRINQRLLRYPALHEKLLDVARRGGVIPGTHAATVGGLGKPDLPSLTPRAREIYNDLKTAIEKRQKGNS